MLDWKGVFPALTTPFTANDELDLPMFKKNLQAQLHAGVHGVVVGGSLGEASVLTVQEKETLVKFAIENIKGKLPVVLNIAESATKEALKQIQQVKIWGAKGDEFIHESIIGSKFIGRIEEETTVFGKPAIKPGIEGWAKIFGYNTITIDPDDDPYAYGFQVI